jgi:hypothetical protein
MLESLEDTAEKKVQQLNYKLVCFCVLKIFLKKI